MITPVDPKTFIEAMLAPLFTLKWMGVPNWQRFAAEREKYVGEHVHTKKRIDPAYAGGRGLTPTPPPQPIPEPIYRGGTITPGPGPAPKPGPIDQRRGRQQGKAGFL